jgi:UDP-4-amino-4,6-dideoxy-N-acetyl-beta-L-altrosamine transaminase
VGVVTEPLDRELRDLPYGRQSIDEEDIAAVVAQLRGDWLTQGPAVRVFEEALSAITGARYAVAMNSGTAALHLACLAAGVREGDSGVTSDITFVASANAIRYAGGRPYLADVDPETALVSQASLREKIAAAKAANGRAPKVVIPVDFSGDVADLPALRAIADAEGSVVIEDAAHSLGATYRHEGATYRAASGVHAHMAILSFHPVKHITTGEGGAVTTNDEGLYRELLDLRTHGITKDPAHLERNDGPWYYEQRTLGFNYRITDVQCALGSSQAKKLSVFLARRREIARQYDEALAPLADKVRPLKVRDGVESAYHLYVVNLVPRAGEGLESVKARRLALYNRLREARIFPQVHYIPVHGQPDYVRAGLGQGSYPGAEQYYAGCISLPMFPAMSDADVARVVTSLHRSIEKP